MADVAVRAGVSAATVSRTINRPDLVNDERRARVWAAIRALGYVLNLDAQRLRIGHRELHGEGS